MTSTDSTKATSGLIPSVARSPMLRVLIAGVLSALVWFCWAYWANRENPDQALVSGLFQGAVNFLTTSLGTAALEILFNRLGKSNTAGVVSVLIVSTLSLLLMVGAHIAANTPNLLLTILPVYGVVILYCSSYILGLKKLNKA